jgi:hypothetical protein
MIIVAMTAAIPPKKTVSDIDEFVAVIAVGASVAVCPIEMAVSPFEE